MNDVNTYTNLRIVIFDLEKVWEFNLNFAEFVLRIWKLHKNQQLSLKKHYMLKIMSPAISNCKLQNIKFRKLNFLFHLIKKLISNM